MRISYFFHLFLATVVFAAVENEYTIEFNENFSMDAFSQAGIQLEERPSVTGETRNRELPRDTRYIFKLPSSNTLVFDAHMGRVSKAYKNEGNAGRLVLYGNKPPYHLTAEEALAVFEQFHDAFQIPKEPLYEWFEPIQQGLGARGYYQATPKGHYPFIVLEGANSFFDERPVFLNLILNFDEKSFKRMGISAETNEVVDLSFDVPALIKSMRSTAHGEPELEQSAEVVTQITETVAETIEEPVKPNISKSSEQAEPTKEATQWWLWLIGAVIIIGGIVTLSRKK